MVFVGEKIKKKGKGDRGRDRVKCVQSSIIDLSHRYLANKGRHYIEREGDRERWRRRE